MARCQRTVGSLFNPDNIMNWARHSLWTSIFLIQVNTKSRGGAKAFEARQTQLRFLNVLKFGQLLINPHCTQYKKAPTFAIGCDCTHRQPSEKEHLYESRKVYRHGRSSGHHLRCRDGC